jgi:hypothetical protein
MDQVTRSSRHLHATVGEFPVQGVAKMEAKKHTSSIELSLDPFDLSHQSLHVCEVVVVIIGGKIAY